MSFLEEKWRNFLFDQTQSIYFSWVQFGASFALFVGGWDLQNEGAGDWYMSDLVLHEVKQFFFGIFLVALGLIGLLTSVNRLITYEGYNIYFLILLSTVFGGGSLAAGIAIWVDWEGTAWITKDTTAVTPIRMILGFFIMGLGVGFFLMLMAHAIRITDFRTIWGKDTNTDEENEDNQDVETQGLINSSDNSNFVQSNTYLGFPLWVIEYFSIFFFFFGVMPALFIFNALLPSDWHKMFPSLMKSWLQTKEGYEWTLVVEYKNNKYMKFYADIILYYGFIFVVSMVSYLALKFNSVKLALRKRISFGSRPDNYGLRIISRPWQITVGEFLFWILFIGMFIILAYFWLDKHTYDSKDKTEREKWARGMGVLSLFFLSCALFSITRIRLWYWCFGLSQEHLVMYHKIFSFLMIWSGYTHFFIWLKWFSVHSLYNLKNNGPFEDLPYNYHSDNFTWAYMYWFMIFVVPIAYLILSMEYFRRNYFELFYYVHLIVGFAFISGILWHATQAWRYLIPPLILYFWDRVLRFISSTQPARVNILCDAINPKNKTSQDVDGDSSDRRFVTKLSFTVAQSSKGYSTFNRPQYRMGQYYFINVPSAGLYEWHPFTISSHEQSNKLTIHAKVEGANSFTSRLFKYATSNISVRDLEIHVDGPYGKVFNSTGYDRIVLAAGGIGVTPCHSIFRTLMQDAYNNDNIDRKPYVELIWIAKTPEIFEIFNDTWEVYQQLNQNPDDKKFQVTLCCTKTSDDNGTTTKGLRWTKGRYNWNQDLQLRNNNENRLLFACGPVLMVHDCETAAYSCGAHFYSESFEF